MLIIENKSQSVDKLLETISEGFDEKSCRVSGTKLDDKTLYVDEEIGVWSQGGGPEMIDASLSVDIWWAETSVINGR